VDGLGDTVITYHSTPIVRFNPDRIVLATGGWDSVTTRRKMHQAAIQFRLPYRVWREKGQSYVMVPKGWRAEVRGLEPVKGPTSIPLADYVDMRRLEA
jgi:hypothetical protein